MDTNDNKGYAYVVGREFDFSKLYTFNLGANGYGDPAAAGVTMDEIYVWHEKMSPQQIWQFYIHGGTYDP